MGVDADLQVFWTQKPIDLSACLFDYEFYCQTQSQPINATNDWNHSQIYMYADCPDPVQNDQFIMDVSHHDGIIWIYNIWCMTWIGTYTE